MIKKYSIIGGGVIAIAAIVFSISVLFNTLKVKYENTGANLGYQKALSDVLSGVVTQGFVTLTQSSSGKHYDLILKPDGK